MKSTRKSSKKPYDKAQQSTSKSQSKSSSADVVIVNNDSPSIIKDTNPSMEQFDKLVNTVNELAVLVKSIKQIDTSVVNPNTGNATATVGQIPNTNDGLEVSDNISRNIAVLRQNANNSSTVGQRSNTYGGTLSLVTGIENTAASCSHDMTTHSDRVNTSVFQNDNIDRGSVNVTNSVNNPELHNVLPSNLNDSSLNPNQIGMSHQGVQGRSMSIQDSVNNHLTQIMGQDYAHSAGKYTPTDLPIDLKVTDKVKNMIWSNQYIDLSILLDPSIEVDIENNHDKYDLVGQFGEPLMVTPRKANRTIFNLGQWCSAFSVFIDIYCKKYPSELSALFTYMNTIKRLSHRSGNYIMYDQEFRYLRQTQLMPWNVTHSGLWFECRDPLNSLKNNRNQKGRSATNTKPSQNNQGVKKSNHPTSYCFRFHNYGKCGRNSCNFKHFCYHPLCANAEHSIIRCPNATKSGDSNNSTKPAQTNKPK